MIKYQDTIGLEELDNKIKKHIIKLGLEEKIKIYGVSTKIKSHLILLNTGQLEYIKSNHPEKSCIITDGDGYQLYAVKMNALSWLNQGKAISVNIDSLRVTIADLNNKQLMSEINIQSTLADDRILGFLLKALVGKTAGGQKISIFNNQTSIVEFLTNSHGGIRGISKTSIENRFSRANKAIENI